MRRGFWSFVVGAWAAVALPATASMAGEPVLRAVASVDLERYAGTWYEIASIPQPFQSGCTCTNATYLPTATDGIEVLNRCLRDGEWTEARGIATPVRGENNARLSVQFGQGRDPGSYVVIGLDEDYQWAVVSSDDQRALWILARERFPDARDIADAVEAAASQLQLTGLNFTDQTDCGILHQ